MTTSKLSENWLLLYLINLTQRILDNHFSTLSKSCDKTHRNAFFLSFFLNQNIFTHACKKPLPWKVWYYSPVFIVPLILECLWIMMGIFLRFLPLVVFEFVTPFCFKVLSFHGKMHLKIWQKLHWWRKCLISTGENKQAFSSKCGCYGYWILSY